MPESVNTLFDNLLENSATTAAMIAVRPGPWLSADLAAHLVDATSDQTQLTLHELLGAELVTKVGQGRYTVHDQVRAPLTDRLTPQARAFTVARLAGFYRLRTAAVEQVLNPWRWRAGTEGAELAHQAQQERPWFTTRVEVLAWMDAELDKVIAVAEMLQRYGRPEVWMVCDHIGTYMVLRKSASAGELYQWGLESARSTGDGRAAGLMLQRLSTALPQDQHEALGLNTQAREAYEQADFTQGVASAYESIGSLLGRLGRLAEAEQAQTRSLHLHREVDNSRDAAFQVRHLAEIHTLQALATTHITGSRVQEASLYVNLADIPSPERTCRGIRNVSSQFGHGPVILKLLFAGQERAARRYPARWAR